MICSVHLKYKYPAGCEDERTRWKAVLGRLNGKCRSFRRPPRDKRAASVSSVISSETSATVSDVYPNSAGQEEGDMDGTIS